jgi:hypothetical protein
MAQTGYTPIQLYYSSTATNVPSGANLTSGELAINIADGKLYFKKIRYYILFCVKYLFIHTFQKNNKSIKEVSNEKKLYIRSSDFTDSN